MRATKSPTGTGGAGSNTSAAILSQLKGVRKSGSGWTAKCPAHEDGSASLSISFTESGRLLAHCFAGCLFTEIREALGLDGERFSPSPRKDETGPTPEQLEAQKKAHRLWQGAKPANPFNPYLTRKKIQPHHARQIGTSLIVPLQDARGDLWNLQFIQPDGTKRFLRGGMTKGLFTFIGEIKETGRTYIAEGFATVATVHQLTGKPCLIGFSAHNLPSVAKTLRGAFPLAEIVLVADADEAGEKYSEQAAKEVNGLICYAGRAF
jgi:putative DNA primase/helicase